MNKSETIFITGISGQDGSYLSRFLINKNYKVIGAIRENDDLSNLEYLKIKDKLILIKSDLRNYSEVLDIIKKYKPSQIYNFAAQSSVQLSLSEPYDTLNFNIMSVVNLLESIRVTSNKIKFFQASSCEIFGNAKDLPVNEETEANPLNPYAISKVSADLIIKNYRKLFGLFACSGFLFHHESYLRNKKFFIKKIIKQSIEIKLNKRDLLKVGNVDVKRDFGYAPDYVENMWNCMQLSSSDDYVFASGVSICLKDIIYYIFKKLDINKDKLVIDNLLFRSVDIKETLGDNTKIVKTLGDKYKSRSFYKVLDILIEEVLKNS